MPRRRVARLRPATVIVLVVLSVAVAVAGTLLAVPGWRAAVLPATNVTTSAAPPVGWRAPETAPPAPLPLDELATSPAPAARALLAAMPKLAKDAAATPGVVVVDPSTGKTLIGRGDKPVLPASTMKVLTGLVALDTLPGRGHVPRPWSRPAGGCWCCAAAAIRC
ncbi:MAG: D-alanyl-D-alanine carboxypeptidase [Micropruina sp.]